MMKSILLVIVSMVFATGAFAATSGSLVLKGVVPQILSISLTPESLATALPLNTTQTNSKIATAVELSNASNGYKITIDSQNKGKPIRSGGNEFLNYSINYGGQGVNLQGSAVVNYGGASSGIKSRDIQISYQGVAHENLVAGDYGDTVTFSISAN